MSTLPGPERRPRWRSALHLLWALPLALVASAFLLYLSSFVWCGVSGCSGGGFGRISNPNVPAAVLFLIGAGGVVGLPVGIVPWSRSSAVRWWMAAAVTVFVCFVGYAMIGP